MFCNCRSTNDHFVSHTWCLILFELRLRANLLMLYVKAFARAAAAVSVLPRDHHAGNYIICKRSFIEGCNDRRALVALERSSNCPPTTTTA